MATNNSTNLYDFLRRLQKAYYEGVPGGVVQISPQESEWIDRFLQAPDHELHFKARMVGHNESKEPIYEQDYQIAGEAVDVFCLLTEAMMQNGSFADMVLKAGDFYFKHIPNCPKCTADLVRARQGYQSWKFNPHDELSPTDVIFLPKPQDDEKK